MQIIYEQDHSAREQWRASETERMKNEFARTGIVPQAMNFEQWQTHREIVKPQQDLQQALEEDIQDLYERYPRSTASFIKKVQRGQINLPEGYETVPNALEEIYIQSITPEEAKAMDAETLAEVIGHAEFEDERRKPLHTRSLDVAIPARKKPAFKPRPKQQMYTVPDLSQEEITDAINYIIQRRGRGR